jgi:hypothetical protein
MEGRLADCRRSLDDAAAIGAGVGSHNALLLTATLRWCLLSETGDGAGVAAQAEGLGLDLPAAHSTGGVRWSRCRRGTGEPLDEIS